MDIYGLKIYRMVLNGKSYELEVEAIASKSKSKYKFYLAILRN